MKPGEFLPQFAAQCVASLMSSAKMADKGELEISGGRASVSPSQLAKGLSGLAWLIKNEAQCFVLPRNAEIYRPHCKVLKKEELASTIGLPAPVCSFEFYMDSRKVLFLMLDPDHFAPNDRPKLSSPNRVLVFAFFFDEEFQVWRPLDQMLVLPLPLDCSDDGGLLVLEVQNLYTEDKVPVNDCYEELAFGADILAQVCTALRAGAKTVEHVEKSPTRRAKFASQGAGGIVYKTLYMPGDKQYAGIPNAVAGGTHASPRHHFRRGHIRQLPTGALTWVRHCLVGSRDSGEVLKTYKVEAVQ